MVQDSMLRLALPVSALADFHAHPLMAHAFPLGPPANENLTYYDTPELTLHERGVIVCACQSEFAPLLRVIATFSQPDGQTRSCWETGFTEQPDFSVIDLPQVRHVLDECASRLIPVFTTELERTSRLLVLRRGVQIRVVSDSGRVRSGEREIACGVVDLILEQGEASGLVDAAISLCQSLPLYPVEQDLVTSGYRLYLREAPKPGKAPKSSLIPEFTPQQAFLALAGQAIAGWKANLHGALTSSDPEYIHQLRVTLRRLRMLLRVFKPLLPEGAAAMWTETLGELAGSTGSARDLDVLREGILQPVLDDKDGKALEKLMQRALAACQQARESALSTLAPGEHGRRMLEFGRVLQNFPPPGKPVTLDSFARARLKKALKRVVRRLEDAWLDDKPENLHRLRISLKDLRYCCEFFAPIFDESAMAGFIRNLAALQDDLGFLNDLEVARHRLGEWAQDDRALLKAGERVSKWHAGRAGRIRSTVLDRTRGLLMARPPWQHDLS